MICELKRLLPGFSIYEYMDEVHIRLPNDQEMYVTIKRTNSYFLIVANERNNHFSIIALNQNEAVVSAFFLVKKWYGIAPDLYRNYANSWTVRRIQKNVNLSNEQKAIKIISAHLDKSFYIIGSEDTSKISLLLYGDYSDVKFHQQFIANHTSLENGYMMLYCYGRIIRSIAYEYKNLSEIMKYPPSLEITQDLYMQIWKLI